MSSDLSIKADEKLVGLQAVREDISGFDSLNLDEALDTEFFVVKFDSKSGAVVSLLQKENGRDLKLLILSVGL